MPFHFIFTKHPYLTFLGAIVSIYLSYYHSNHSRCLPPSTSERFHPFSALFPHSTPLHLTALHRTEMHFSSFLQIPSRVSGPWICPLCSSEQPATAAQCRCGVRRNVLDVSRGMCRQLFDNTESLFFRFASCIECFGFLDYVCCVDCIRSFVPFRFPSPIPTFYPSSIPLLSPFPPLFILLLKISS